MDKKAHWENVYAIKTPQEVSWTQAVPQSSINLIETCKLSKDAAIIDIGGGDSLLVDFLLDLGYQNISVLDISAKAIERAKVRLGECANKVTWIVSDIASFKPTQVYDCWHDRAAFHFLTDKNDIEYYIRTVNEFVVKNLIIGTFSTNGPKKCSGLDIQQYDETSMAAVFSPKFKLRHFEIVEHTTPFDTTQEFIFGKFDLKS